MAFTVLKVAFFITVLYAVCNGVPDSVGTNFVTVLPWNNGNINQAPDFRMHFVNMDATKTANVALRYMVWSVTGWNIVLTPSSLHLQVPPSNFTEYKFPTTASYQYLAQGFNYYPDSRVFVDSDNPITVIAHNYMPAGGAGDSYIVTPITMAGMAYSVSLPASSPSGFSVVYLLPATTDVTIKLNVVTVSSNRVYEKTLGFAFNETSKVAMFGGPSKDTTVYVEGSAPFLVVAAVRKLPVSSASTKVDFGCYMPSPLASTVCEKGTMRDDHVTDLTTSNYFTFSPPASVCSFDLSLYGSKTGPVQENLVGDSVRSPRAMLPSTFGTNAAVHSDAAMVNMMRYGGYNQGAVGFEEGAYIDTVPSTSQFVTGSTGFVVTFDQDQVTFFGDETMSKSALLDGKAYRTFETVTYSIGVYYFAIANLNKGFHVFTADGSYTVHVSGSSNYAAYGYTPILNKQVALLPTNESTIAPIGTTTKLASAASAASQSSVSSQTSTTTGPILSSTTTTTTTKTTPTVPQSTLASTVTNENRDGGGATCSFSAVLITAISLISLIAQLH